LTSSRPFGCWRPAPFQVRTLDSGDSVRADFSPAATGTHETDIGMADDKDKGNDPSQDDWQLWPPSPKMQIVLIAIGFGLFNMMLLAIWAWVMIREFG
jgi:hypothetical protein